MEEKKVRHVFILSFGHREAAAFARTKGFHQQNWSYLSNASQLNAAPRGHGVLFVSRWRRRSDLEQVMAKMEERDMVQLSASDVRIAGEADA